jgi:hypothetical protein
MILKQFIVDEDVNKMKEEIVQLANKVGFDVIDLSDVGDLLSHSGLSSEVLIKLEKRKEGGIRGGEYDRG